MNDLQRFSQHISVNPTTGCHEWTRAKNPKGYGQFSVRRSAVERACCPRGGNKRVQAHRWLFEQYHGPVPEGYEVDHKCLNRSCVNLEHLQCITKPQNLALRGIVHLD